MPTLNPDLNATMLQSRLALGLLLMGAFLTMGAKFWAEQPIDDIATVAGTWKGKTFFQCSRRCSVTFIIEENGAYEGKDRNGTFSGTLRIGDGKILYQTREGHNITLTLQRHEREQVLRGFNEDGELTVLLEPAKPKRAKRKQKRKQKKGKKLSVEEAKQIIAELKDTAFRPPPKSINDVLALVGAQDLTPPDCEAYPRLSEDEVRELIDTAPRAGSGLWFNRATVAEDQASIAFLRGNFPASIKYLKWAIDETPFDWRNAQAMRYARLATYYAFAGDFRSADRAISEARRLWSRSRHYLHGHPRWVARVRFDVHRARAAIADSKGDLIRAEAYHRRAIKAWGGGWFELAKLGLARNLMRQGRLMEAERVVRGVLAEETRTSVGADISREQSIVPIAFGQLSGIMYEQGRYGDAEALARVSMKLHRAVCAAPENPHLATVQNVLGRSLVAQGRWQETLAQYEAIRSNMAADPETFERLFAGNLAWAMALLEVGQIEQARDKLRHALDRAKRRLGKDHYETTEIRGFLALTQLASGDRTGALKELSSVIETLLERSREASGEGTSLTARDRRLKFIIDAYIGLLTDSYGTDLERDSGINVLSEAFRLADVARSRAVQRALSASGARAALPDPALTELARQEQNTQMRIAALYGTLAQVLARPVAEQDRKMIRTLQTTIDQQRAARAAVLREIEKRFPAYAALADPKPATMSQARTALRTGDALIATYTTAERTYVWAVPASGQFAFAAVELGLAELKRIVTRLRAALDPQAEALGDIPAFDLAAAWRLYETLLKPVEAGWKGSKHLWLVGHGPLAQLPILVLPTTPFELPPETSPLFANYRAVPWLARTHTISALPSVASLITLHKLPAGDPTRRAFAGFGDPWFNEAQATLAQAEGNVQVAQVTRRGFAVRGLPLARRSVPQTRSLDSAALAKLPRLPGTGDEVKSIARALKANPSTDVFTGAKASESQVKSMDLSDRRVIAFATHGLVPGDLDGLTQPALALSSPQVTGEKDDGLLTMGEILGLKLNADWVVLSACNTAAAEGKGAEAVSGLGRAFFYAGARALLVSNWPVETTSAKALTTDLFQRQGKDPTLTRAEALRQAMLQLIDGPGYVDARGRTLFSYAHPIFWAPFSLVGDGG